MQTFWALFRRLRSPSAGGGPWLHNLCSSTDVHMPAPPVRTRSPAVEIRLAGLRADLEAKQYAQMVQGATAAVRFL